MDEGKDRYALTCMRETLGMAALRGTRFDPDVKPWPQELYWTRRAMNVMMTNSIDDDTTTVNTME